MRLSQLLAAAQCQDQARIASQGQSALMDPQIDGVYYDSRLVAPGGLFVAVPGFSADGHAFIAQAVANGAVAVVSQQPVADPGGAVVVQVADARTCLAQLAAAFYDHPSRAMTLIGVTGTNGKTTTTYLIESILQVAGFSPGVIGTINYRYAGRSFDNPVTTPESLDLQRILAGMRSAGVTHAAMEVSSHALDLQRVHGCAFDLGVFTNLTQDHLDYHRDMETYWACKRKLFTDLLPASRSPLSLRAVINRHDPKGQALADSLDLPHLTTATTPDADVYAESADFSLQGVAARIRTPLGAVDVRCPLVGHHNLENILNAAGVGVALGIPLPTIADGIAALARVPGRLEPVANALRRFVYVDYAHTPDALENVLKALRALTRDRIVCVFGCGGDRDRCKRPLMGAIAGRLSDWVIVTSDNPRTEAPEVIIEQILTGLPPANHRRLTAGQLAMGFSGQGVVVEPDRRKAIALSLQASQPGDTILIAGKGHEPYQIIGRQKYPFDDRLEAQQALDRLAE